MSLYALIVFSAMALLSSPTSAQTITDGDTPKLNGTVYRLWGIDAPEIKQDCPDGRPRGGWRPSSCKRS